MRRLLLLIPALALTAGSAEAQKTRTGEPQGYLASDTAPRGTAFVGAPRNLTVVVQGSTANLTWAAPEPSAGGDLSDNEPNGRYTEAQELFGPAPILLRGSVEADDAGQLSVSFADNTVDDFEDLFWVTFGPGGGTVQLEGLTADCDLYALSLATGVLEIVAESFNIGYESESVSTSSFDPAFQPGRYLVAVTLFDPGQDGLTSDYTLTITGDVEAEGVTGYRVYRSGSAGAAATGSMVAEVDASVTALADGLPDTGTYHFQVTAVGETGAESAPSNEASIVATSVQSFEAPAAFRLHQNWPNPFNPVTRIAFEVSEPGIVRLEIRDILGRLVSVPLHGPVPAGRHEVSWEPGELPTGSYFYHLEGASGSASRMMTYLR